MALTTHAGKGSELTWAEGDANFTGLADGSLIIPFTSGTRTLQTVLGDVINVKNPPYNAAGDGTTDDTTALQAAINAGILTGRRVFLPSGVYKITSSLLIYTASTTVTVGFVGEQKSSRDDRGAIIKHSTILTAPALIIQGGREVLVDWIAFRGPNIISTPVTAYAASEWTVGGVRDSRYSPQCAIAIDPFASSAPADGGYPTLTAYYAATALASSATKIRNCHFEYQVVGIFNGPNAASNNENNIYEDLNFVTCKTAISFGQLQSKGCAIRSLFATWCYTVIDTYTYSDRNGSAGFTWHGGDVAGCNSIIRTLSQVGGSVAITQGFNIDGVYAEGIWTIGWIGDAIGFTYLPGEFSNCTFWFAESDTQRADANLVNFSSTKFSNCTFWSTTLADQQKGHAIKFYHHSEGHVTGAQKSYLIFDNCRFMSDTLPLFPNAAMPEIVMRECVNHSSTGLNTFKAVFSDRVRITDLGDVTNQCAVWPGILIEDKSTGNLHYVKQGMNSVSIGTISVTVSSFGATFTAADATTIQVGDVIYATSQLLTKIDDTTFTAATWPLGVATIAATTAITLNDVGPNAATSSLALTLQWYPRMHGASTIATHTSTTAEIPTPAGTNAWAAGDRVIASDLTAGTYIVSGTAPNFVLSKAATGTSAAHRCYDADASTITQVAL